MKSRFPFTHKLNRNSRRIGAGLTLLVVTACGGGADPISQQAGGVGDSGVLPVVVSKSAPDVPVPAGSQKLIGAHTLSLARLNAGQIQLTNGAEAANGAVTLADGSSIFVGESGYVSGSQRDGSSSIWLFPTQGAYQTAKMYTGGISDPGAGVSYGIVHGVYGVEASGGALSTTRTATYIGEASGVYSTGSEAQVSLNNGTAKVEVNFATGLVDVDITNFEPNTAPFDSVFAVNLPLDGTRYEGDQVGAFSGNTIQNALGAGPEWTATGVLLGNVDAQGIPDETAGVLYGRGDDGSLGVVFIAK